MLFNICYNKNYSNRWNKEYIGKIRLCFKRSDCPMNEELDDLFDKCGEEKNDFLADWEYTDINEDKQKYLFG